MTIPPAGHGPPDGADDDTHVIGRVYLPDDEPTVPGPPTGPPYIDPSELAGLHDASTGAVAGVRRVLPLEDEPSSLVARYLFPTERYRGEWKAHLIHLAGPILIGVVATFALGWLSGSFARWGAIWMTYTALLVWLGIMGYVGWRVADWHFDRFILTNKRIMKISGIITRNVAMMPLLRVTDMKYEQTPLGRVLNYGTFVIESAGQDQALREVPYLPSPNELYLRVVEEMYEPAAVEARLGNDTEESEDEQKVGDS
jgi:membrane protein YdbS with pleckstrin-like domain